MPAEYNLIPRRESFETDSGLSHSRTLRESRQILGCGSPLPLSFLTCARPIASRHSSFVFHFRNFLATIWAFPGMRKRVLLFEPLQADQQAFRDAVHECQLDVELIIAGTLTETMAYLSGADFFRDRYSFPLPDFCVLNVNDINGGGFALLRWIRA